MSLLAKTVSKSLSFILTDINDSDSKYLINLSIEDIIHMDNWSSILLIDIIRCTSDLHVCLKDTLYHKIWHNVDSSDVEQLISYLDRTELFNISKIYKIREKYDIHFVDFCNEFLKADNIKEGD